MNKILCAIAARFRDRKGLRNEHRYVLANGTRDLISHLRDKCDDYRGRIEKLAREARVQKVIADTMTAHAAKAIRRAEDAENRLRWSQQRESNAAPADTVMRCPCAFSPIPCSLHSPSSPQ